MENISANDIINSTIRYKLDSKVIKAKASTNQFDEQAHMVHVEQILGVDVDWTLEAFSIENLYEYFEINFIEELFDHLLNNNIGNYYDRYDSMIGWITDEARDVMYDELYDYCKKLGVKWELAFYKIVNKMGEAGFLSASIYYNVISGYFESVANEYFKIDVSGTRYITSEGHGQTKIRFYDGNSITVVSDFLTGHQFYYEVTRHITTDVFLDNIRKQLKELICRKTNST